MAYRYHNLRNLPIAVRRPLSRYIDGVQMSSGNNKKAHDDSMDNRPRNWLIKLIEQIFAVE